MAAPFIQTSFAKGEIAPSLWGHVDLTAFHTAASTARNMYVGFRGGLYSRAGTRFVGRSKQRPDQGQAPPRIINWQFNNQQGYAVEFGDAYARLIFQGGYVTEAPLAIVGATQAAPCEISTLLPHGYAVGDWVALAGIGGMTELNGNTYIVATVPTTSTFTLETLDGAPIDSTGFTPYTSGGTAARIYTIASPYAAVDLGSLKFDQSADVMSLTCVNLATGAEYPPYDLKRLGPVNWTLTQTNFGSSIAAPASATVTATTQPNPSFVPPTLPAAYAYEVTAVDPVTGEESQASPVAGVTNGVDMAQTAGSNVINWAAVVGVGFYNVYRAPTSYNTNPSSPTVALPVPTGALFGLVGSSFGTQFVDTNIVPNVAISPPLHQNPFAPGQIVGIKMGSSGGGYTFATASIVSGTGSGFVGECVIDGMGVVSVIVIQPGQFYLGSDALVISGDGSGAGGTLVLGPQTGTYPGVISYFQQRRVYAQTLNAPDTYFMSQPGAFTNFDSSIPVSDADAIAGTPWSEKVDGISWMLTMPLGLLTFTGSGVWQIGAPGSFASSPQAITPSNQIAAPQSSIGCSNTVPPIKVNWDVIYLEHNNSSVLDLTYQIFFNIFAGTDISWASSHLLENYQILQWCYCRTPNRIIWAVRNDGVLLSLTYLKEQEVVGWARHDTQGQVRSVCSVIEPPVDALYMVVERPYQDGFTRYFIERMNDRLWSGVEDSWCVDAAVATVLPTPAGPLYASSASGPVTFATTTADLFTPDDIGQILRMGGGIAVINGEPTSHTLTGQWILPCRQLLPNDPNGSVLPQPAGAWSIAPNVTTVSGLSHLAGRQVVGIADGVPIGLSPSLRTSFPWLPALSFGLLIPDSLGNVTLPFPASNVVIGLSFAAQAQSVYLDAGQPTVQGRRKAIYAVTVRCEASALSQVGANQADVSAISPPPLFETWSGLATGVAANVSPTLPPPYTSPGGVPVQPLFTGDQRVVIPAQWQKPGQVAVQQILPLPLGLLAFVPEVLGGDTPEVELPPRQQPQQPARQPMRRAA